MGWRFIQSLIRLSERMRYRNEGHYDGFLPVKVKDEVKLANYVHMIVIPSEYKDQIMKVMPEQLSDRAFCLSHDKLDVWQWSEKVYSFVRDMAKSNVN